MTLLFMNPAIKFWGSMVILVIVMLIYFTNQLTRGRTIDYLNYQMSSRLKNTLMNVHGFSALILALLLPNNYLNKIDFFKKLYNEDELWIAGTMLILLFLLILCIGIVFSFAVKWLGLKRIKVMDASK